jgi:hypothetical protein
MRISRLCFGTVESFQPHIVYQLSGNQSRAGMRAQTSAMPLAALGKNKQGSR